MVENLDRFLEKLNLTLKLIRDYNSTLKRIESWGESRHINSISSDDARESEVVYEAEPDPEVVEHEPEAEPEIVDELEPNLKVDQPDPVPKVKDSNRGLCRSSGRAYHETFVVIANYEGLFIPEASWCVWPVTDLST